MAGVKRTYAVMEQLKAPQDASPVATAFEHFRVELDEHHDRREKVVKVSRDLTAQSKKIIFALQRTRDLGKPIHGSISKQTIPMYDTIRGLLENVAPELQGINADRYQHSISGGIQEYMEAVLFQHYLESRSLMSYEEAAGSLPPGLRLTYEDYVLGIFDMTGELMRFAVTNMATSRSGSSDLSILADMQSLRSELEALSIDGSRSLARDYESKLRVTKQSVEKVENSAYSMLVRGKERPKGWRPDADGRRDAEEIESY